MKTLLVLSSLLTVSSLAHAEPSVTANAQPESQLSPGYIAVGAEADSTLAFDTGFTLDAGYRLGSSPWLVHGQLARGDASDLQEALGGGMSVYGGNSRWTRVRAGLEHDACIGSTIVACGIVGVDVGVLHTGDTTGPFGDSLSASYTDELITPKVGYELGFRHLRYYGTLGLDVGVGQRTTMDGTTSRATGGAEIETGVVYRF